MGIILKSGAICPLRDFVGWMLMATRSVTCLSNCYYLYFHFSSAMTQINGRTAAGWSPLHACAETGNIDMARLLLSDEYDADPLATSKTGDLPLHVAARWGYAELVELFAARQKIASSVDVDVDDDDDEIEDGDGEKDNKQGR